MRMECNVFLLMGLHIIGLLIMGFLIRLSYNSKISDLSLRSGIMCKYTAFVGFYKKPKELEKKEEVEKMETNDVTNDVMNDDEMVGASDGHDIDQILLNCTIEAETRNGIF